MDKMNRYVISINSYGYIRDYDEDFESVEVVRDVNKAYEFPSLALAKKVRDNFGGIIWRVGLMFMNDKELEDEGNE